MRNAIVCNCIEQYKTVFWLPYTHHLVSPAKTTEPAGMPCEGANSCMPKDWGAHWCHMANMTE